MNSCCLKNVHLDESDKTPLLRHERELALNSLSEGGLFQPANTDIPGPYNLRLGTQDARLVLQITGANGATLPALILSLKPYTRLVRDYFMMIESYELMRRDGTADQLEAVDMGRRGLHDEGAALLIERLTGKVSLDHHTARQLFTLICILHGQRAPLY